MTPPIHNHIMITVITKRRRRPGAKEANRRNAELKKEIDELQEPPRAPTRTAAKIVPAKIVPTKTA